MPAAPRRHDDQTDYEDPVDRHHLYDNRPKAKKKTHPAANTAYACGLVSLVPCLGAVLGPIAVIYGLKGLADISSDPASGGKGRAKSGIWFGSLACVINFGLPALFYVLARWR